MNIHLKIWVPGLLSFIAYVLAQVFIKPIATVLYAIWGILQLVAAYYAWVFLKNYKHRSGTWIILVATLGLLGIILIYLIPAKKIVPSIPNPSSNWQ